MLASFAAMAAAESPEERETVPSQLSKKTKTQKRKITHRDSERDRFDSLTWNSSLSVNEDNEHFSSLFIGSGELDGGKVSRCLFLKKARHAQTPHKRRITHLIFFFCLFQFVSFNLFLRIFWYGE